MISIIIPTLDEEAAIEKTIRQFEGVSTPHEVIVADGGSTDWTVEISKKFADKVIERPEDGSQIASGNRNRGAKAASGDILMFLDSEVIVKDPEQFLQRALKHFAGNPRLVGLIPMQKVLPGQERISDRVILGIMNASFFVINNILHIGNAQGKCQIIPKAVFEKTGGYREDLPAAEDMDLFYRLGRIGRTTIDRNMVIYHSARRARAWGWPKLIYRWQTDQISYLLRNKVISKEWKKDWLNTNKVSIVIPAYNEEKYIEATLKAALAQDYPDFEVVVVDNASTDRTAEIVVRYPTVKLAREDSRGTQFARERGRLVATGSIIACLDADCLPKPDWLSRGVLHFKAKNVVAVTGPANYYDWSGLYRRSALVIQEMVYIPVHTFLQTTGLGAILIANNCFIRKSALDAVGGYNTALTFWGDDTDTAQRLMTRGKIVFDFALPMDTSARRFKDFGTFRTFYRYIKAFVSTTIQSSSRSPKKDSLKG